jgi:hypothetical protein
MLTILAAAAICIVQLSFNKSYNKYLNFQDQQDTIQSVAEAINTSSREHTNLVEEPPTDHSPSDSKVILIDLNKTAFCSIANGMI